MDLIMRRIGRLDAAVDDGCTEDPVSLQRHGRIRHPAPSGVNYGSGIVLVNYRTAWNPEDVISDSRHACGVPSREISRRARVAWDLRLLVKELMSAVGGYGWQVVLVVVLVLLNAAFSGSEMALISLRESQLQRLE